ncbi:MAG TPA: TetR/AcrR family transcriptional regulator [Streptosporangiaceae bacterium]|jgi:AcrR family transcriptional regulator
MPRQTAAGSTAAQPPEGGDSSRGDSSNRILEAAIAEFGAYGFAGARVNRIADLAGVNKQLIYYYFQNKSGLYEAALKRLIVRGFEVRRRQESQDFREWLHQISDPKQVDAQQWHRFWLWEALERDPKNILLSRDRRHAWAEFVQHVRDAQSANIIDDSFDPQLLSLALRAITTLPHILPQVTKLVLGHSNVDRRFKDRQAQFLNQLLDHLAPASATGSASDSGSGSAAPAAGAGPAAPARRSRGTAVRRTST